MKPKQRPPSLSIISNGSGGFQSGDQTPTSPVSPLPNGDRRFSTDITPSEKRLYPGQEKRYNRLQRVRKRVNILLHTHIALIAVCILSSLDAVCVIGQVICDILIMSDELSAYDDLHEKATEVLTHALPEIFNDTDTDYTTWSFEYIIEHIEQHSNQLLQLTNDTSHHRDSATLLTSAIYQPLLSRYRRATGGAATYAAGGHGEHEEHDLLHELTHSFHIGSMAILSVLLAETFAKIFAMWKHLLNHKLEIFDAFVIMVSWSLDVAFWEGIWANTGQEGATLLIFILPWRVIRIVNSFVLVIQEKDLVMLKLVKQRLRLALRKDKESAAKLDKYRLEVRQLQGLCRKHGADENSIQACCPTGRRRRSSLFQSLTSLASVALVAMGSSPNPDRDEHVSSSSDSEDDQRDLDVEVEVKKGRISRENSQESGVVSMTAMDATNGFTSQDLHAPNGYSNQGFQYNDETTLRTEDTNDGLSTKL